VPAHKKHGRRYRKAYQRVNLDEKLRAAATKGLLILPIRSFRLSGSPLELTGRSLSEILQEIRG